MSTQSRCTIVLLLACLIGAPALLVSQKASALFEQAMLKENAEGSLNEAIALFSRIADDKTAEPAIRAKAQLHIGICYEKLGRREATAAYQKVVDSFPLQRPEVDLARERLGRLLGASKEEAGRPTFRKVHLPNRITWDAQLSPDGTSIAVVNVPDGRLWIAPASGTLGPGFPGTPRALDTQGVQVDWPGFTWSGDGRFIAFNGAKVEGGRQRIYVVSAHGGSPTLVHENNRDARVVNYRMSLAPNGQAVAFAALDGDVLHVYKKPVKGGSPARLVDAPAREPVFSPDGKMIAYVEDKNLGRGGGGLWVIPADGGVPALVARAENASSPVWSPNGDMLAFVDIAAANQVHVVRLERNRAEASETTRIDCPEGVRGVRRLAGWTPSNEIWAVVESPTEFALYTQDVDGGKATFVTHGGYPVQPRWTPDGRRIFHVNDRGNASGDWQELGIASVPAEGGDITRIPLRSDVKIRLQGYGTGNRVSPDGRTIVFAGHRSQAPTSTMHIWTLAATGGTPRQLTDAPAPFRDWYPCWSPDGRNIAFVRMKEPETWTDAGEGDIYVIPAGGGEARRITSVSDRVFSTGPVMWSPDGKSLAFFSRDVDSVDGTIKVIPAGGGPPRVVAKVAKVFANTELAWSPDGRRIAYNAPGNKIAIVTLEGGATVEIEPDLKGVKQTYHLDWSPDGKTLVFGGAAGGDPEIWTIGNFLPVAKEAAVAPAQKVKK